MFDFGKLFRGCRDETSTKSSTSRKLQQTLKMLEEKEVALQKKVSVELKRAKEFTRTCNKQAALQCLKRKRFYESQIEQLWSFQLRIHDQQHKQSQKHENGDADGCNKRE